MEQILEGVTAGGQWRSGVTPVTDRSLYSSSEIVAPVFCLKTDAAYASRAARNFPALVRALDLMIYAPDSAEAVRVARQAMAEALKD